MSDKDQAPPEPEERDDRTIFRPMPPRAGPSQNPAAGASPSAPQAPADMTVVSFADERTVFRPNPGGRRAPGQPAPAPNAAPPPRKASTQGRDLVAPNANPILQAAGPLLLLLGRLRTALVRTPGHNLTAQIAAAIEKCDRDMIGAGVAPDEANTAKYVLCATADEVLANLPADERGGAAQSGLTTRFFGETSAGRRLYDELARVEEDPRDHYFLLELFHACLALAFPSGRQAGAGPATAAGAIDTVRANLRDLLQQNGPAAPAALSPRWQGQPLAGHAVRLRVPFWAAAGLIGLVLFGAFIWFRVSLGAEAETAAQRVGALNPLTPVAIGRKVAVAPPPAPPPTPAQASQLDHVRNVLAPNIQSGALSVDATANQIVIRIIDRALFQPGKSTMLDDVKPLMMYIAMALDDDRGAVKVIGHSDNTPISNARFASNFELSLERANVVGALLKQSLSHPERVETEGKGADAPIAPNDTPEGRAKNRRVEIVVPRSD
ncbi:type VI secretion system OmpA/MotB family protein [Methylocella silvestris BL2]|uniref:Type VI secretion system OmpA/MotB family protein n=1 Tax=Methylocella silvestris (strain DSM 15510 / CIP 108128 / LMG 27833 / NCIMB 13906 / BL2) TaxID=395965 RepID=B8ETF7_METSB|nr:type VI secretion system protein TssL, long form [Methylocella silvestris]ACK51799.1 type VI secretion system OmpA/MotB family protein [Methylocella silvestris BL2]